MKKNLLKFFGISLVALTAFFTGCTEPEQFDENFPRTPIVSATEVVSVAREVAVVKVTVADADQLEYVVGEGSAKVVDITAENASPLNVTLEGLTANTDYTVNFTAIAGEARSKVVPVSFKTAIKNKPTVAIAEPVIDGSNAKFTVTLGVDVTNYAYACTPTDSIAKYAEGEGYPREWVEKAVVAAPSQDVVIELADLVPFTDYTLEVKAENSDCAIDAPVAALFTTDYSANDLGEYKIAKITPGAFDIKVDFEVDNALCDGVLVYATDNPLWYTTDGFLESVAWTAPQITENSTYVISASTNYLPVVPGKTYLLASVAVKDGQAIGVPVETCITSGDFVEGEGAPIDITISNVDIFTATATLERIEIKTVNFYSGFAKKSEVSNGDVAQYIRDSSWFNGTSVFIQSFSKYDLESLVDEVELPVFGLIENTDYYYFAFAVDAEGNVGQINTAEFKTKAIEKNENCSWEVEITPSMSSAKVDFTFGEECEAIAYYNGPKYDSNSSEAQVFEQLIKSLIANDPYAVVTNDGSGVATAKVGGLSLGTEYTLYTIGRDKDGKYGNISKVDYEPEPVEYDSKANLVVTKNAIEVSDAWGSLSANVTLGVQMTEGAVSYIYGAIDKAYVANPSQLESYGDYLLANSWSSISCSEPEVYVSLYTKDYIAVFIPVDADGKYGMPQYVELTEEEWGGDSGSSEGGDVNPR